ncbi:response regulator [Ancylothrix sp. C2]|uniref:response regulator n=1 Tax=Ancylothrix sp. D3o TaxID=2953691 RepID=UPI0021BAD054|nr:response regulator [Ancylothrix sp. D3o]MCT7951515.1 response regulator [Ancylothrix sp. D3o]
MIVSKIGHAEQVAQPRKTLLTEKTMALILIVDDALITRTVIRKIVQGQGYTTLEADNGRKAVDMALLHQPDCILLDLLLPELNGWQVIEALNEKGSKIPVIFITADTQDTTRDKCLGLGALAVVNKPPKLSELQQVIQKALALNKEAN